MFTDSQNNILNEKAGYVEVMAESLWDANQKADYDPMHPQWKNLEDPIKNDYRLSASLAVLANSGESVSFDGDKLKDCVGQLVALLEGGYDPHSYYHTDVIDDAKRLIKKE